MIRLGLILACYAVVSCSVLAVVNNFTSPKIAQNQVNKVNDAMKVFFPEEGFSFEEKTEFESRAEGSVKVEKLIIAIKMVKFTVGQLRFPVRLTILLQFLWV